jgi:3-oxoacyl-[acyl-carrier protein] reductase
MTTSLQNKIALVTGAGRGIGRAIALQLAAAGAIVFVNDCAAERVADCVDELRRNGWQAHAAIADVAEAEAVNQLFANIARAYGKLDILVNNAALSRPRLCIETSDEDWATVLSVNLTGVFYCCRAAFPLLQKSENARVVNLSSVSAYTGKVVSDNAAYIAAKAGVDGLTRALAREWAAHGITVNSIAPGVVETELHAQLSEAQRAQSPALIPSGRLTTTEEIAAAVSYLISPAASQMTGQILHINGGMYFA